MSEVEIKNENTTGEEVNSRVYELGYLLASSISEDNLPVVFGNLKELVISLGGVTISEEMPKMITLAYTMKKVIANIHTKFNSAYFGWIKFTMDSDKILELKKKLDLDPNFIRFLILKTVKENTIAAKRFVRGEIHRRAMTKKGEIRETASIDEEKIDKEIDALVEA